MVTLQISKMYIILTLEFQRLLRTLLSTIQPLILSEILTNQIYDIWVSQQSTRLPLFLLYVYTFWLFVLSFHLSTIQPWILSEISSTKLYTTICSVSSKTKHFYVLLKIYNLPNNWIWAIAKLFSVYIKSHCYFNFTMYLVLTFISFRNMMSLLTIERTLEIQYSFTHSINFSTYSFTKTIYWLLPIRVSSIGKILQFPLIFIVTIQPALTYTKPNLRLRQWHLWHINQVIHIILLVNVIWSLVTFVLYTYMMYLSSHLDLFFCHKIKTFFSLKILRLFSRTSVPL